ncbi:MAG: peptidase S8, partial [Chloroflexi bacterium]|nr:peptidase S8 [Chloroflexota bacterium]
MFKNNRGKMFFTAVVVLALLCAPVGVYASPPKQAPLDLSIPHAPGRILVKFKGGVSKGERLLAHAEHQGKVMAEESVLGIEVVQVAEEQMAHALARYRGNPRVAYAEPDYLVEGAFTPNDPSYSTRQYGPQKVQANLAWDITVGSSDVIVAVLDSGADFGHPDLQGKLIAGWDYVNGDGDPADDHGHGTHVAGIVGAGTNNSEGIAGIGFNTRLLVVKVLDQNNVGYYSAVISGIVYAANNGARVINMSLAGPTWSLSLWEAVEYAWNKGCLLVAAAGNGNTSAPYYPAAFEHVMGVAATDANDARWSLSNYGDYISVAAPGQGIYSTDWLGGAGPYAARSGTSQAAPHVSGVAALLLSRDGSLTNAQL